MKRKLYPKFEKKKDQESNLVTKMARYHYLIPHLMENKNNIVFIAIVRHPCAVLNSWRKAPKEYSKDWNFKEEWRFAQSKNQFKPEEYYGFHKWKEATKLFIEMKAKFPDRIILVKYENLVRRTFAEVKRLFDFVELEITNQTLDFIKESTQKHTEDAYGVFKGKKDITEWKDELSSEIIRTINKELMNTEFENFL